VVSAEIARARARALRALVFAGREPGHTRADAAVAGREVHAPSMASWPISALSRWG